MLLGRELKLTYFEILDLPDEVYCIYVNSLFKVLSKQVGMGSVGYDFSETSSKKVSDYLNFNDGE